MRLLVRLMAPPTLLLAAAAALGFMWFVRQATLTPAGLPPAADGIVVLTGGADRVRAGVALLREGRARVLLISGVGAETSLPAILAAEGLPADTPATAITLGHAAMDTAGNARETATWVAAQGVHSLIVVTASYHMPRALLELRRTLPQVRMVAAPVVPPALRDGGGVGTMRLLGSEYGKWLASWAGV